MPGSTTRTVHGDDDLPSGHSVAPPIYQTATFHAETGEEFTHRALEVRNNEFYTRYGNPTHSRVAGIVADLEGAEVGIVTSSGMGAVTTLALSLLHAGDHVIVQRSTYGGTASLASTLLSRLGVDSTQVDQTDVAAFERAIRPATRLALLETPSNPLLELTDLRAVTSLCRDAGVRTAVDNTFATPINQQPLSLGADLVWHSATKYLGGHADLTAGVIAGSAELLDEIWRTAVITGVTPSPFDAWLLLRGIRTLSLRVERHNSNAAALAQALQNHPAVERVRYPGLASHPQHDLAKRQMTGFGGMLSIELRGGIDATNTFLDRLRYVKRAASLGGVSSLAVNPASMWAAMLSPDEMAATGITLGLVRISVGIEDEADLLCDLTEALNAVA